VRARVEHVFAAQKHRVGLVIRTVGQLRAAAKIALANLTYNLWTPRTARCPAAAHGIGCINLSGLFMRRLCPWP
jgi:hypothetical protein